MTRFSDLSRAPIPKVGQDGSLKEWQATIDGLFPSAVSNSALRLWSPGDPIPAEGNRLLLGVATWSEHDMQLLDTVSAALGRNWPDLTVQVFNVADCQSPQAFDHYVPGIGMVFHTPVVGLWCDGKLVEKASGEAGRDLVARVCGLGPL